MSVYLKCKANGDKFTFEGKTTADKPYLAMNYTTQTGSNSSQTTISKAYFPLTTNTEAAGLKRVAFKVSGSKMFVQGVKTTTTSYTTTTQTVSRSSSHPEGGSEVFSKSGTFFDYAYDNEMISSFYSQQSYPTYSASTINYTRTKYTPITSLITGEMSSNTNYNSVDLSPYNLKIVNSRTVYLTNTSSNTSYSVARYIGDDIKISDSNKARMISFLSNNISNAYISSYGRNGDNWYRVIQNCNRLINIYSTFNSSSTFLGGGICTSEYYANVSGVTRSAGSIEPVVYFQMISSDDNPSTTKTMALFSAKPDMPIQFLMGRKINSITSVGSTYKLPITMYTRTLPSPKASNYTDYYVSTTESLAVRYSITYAPAEQTTVNTTTIC